MNLADVGNLLGAFVGFVLTLLVFSYVFGDNVLFRLALHIFIGATAGYVTAMTIYNVIGPRLLSPLVSGLLIEKLMALIPLILSLMLFSRVFVRSSFISNLVVAMLVGVSAAAAVGGALTGTLFPQMRATINGFDTNAILQSGKSLGYELLNGVIILLGTTSTLIYFQFSTRVKAGLAMQQPFALKIISFVGQVFIALAFGSLFVGVYAAALTALIERMNAIIQFILQFIWPVS